MTSRPFSQRFHASAALQRPVPTVIASHCQSLHIPQARISSNKPTIDRSHLLKVASLVPKDMRFAPETNGILIRRDSRLAEDLARFARLHVRESLKSTAKDEFAPLTSARPEAFEPQIHALANLDQARAPVHAAVMTSFSPHQNIAKLRPRLAHLASRFAEFEDEEPMLNCRVAQCPTLAGIAYRSVRRPGRRTVDRRRR
jgi:uncharacterized Fe-S cluster-containing radical SAM superfamily protein